MNLLEYNEVQSAEIPSSACFSSASFFHPKDEAHMFLRNDGLISKERKAPYPKR
jgi:hypothetical protein